MIASVSSTVSRPTRAPRAAVIPVHVEPELSVGVVYVSVVHLASRTSNLKRVNNIVVTFILPLSVMIY